MGNVIKISIIASISVKSHDALSQFVKSWSIYLDSNIDLIVCVNDTHGYSINNKHVKIVVFNDNRGMFKYNIQQKKYFASKHSSSDYMFFIHDRIQPNKITFFKNLSEFLKFNDVDYLSFLINNVDNTISLPEIYMDLNSNLKEDFFSYITNLSYSRGCLFEFNEIPSINGAAFLLNKNKINLLDNNYRWGEMEDQKLTFDLFKFNSKGLVYKNDLLLTNIFKPELKQTNKAVLYLHKVFKLVYFPFFLFPNINTVYSKINFQKEVFLLKRNNKIYLIDLLHKPFHTTIYKNSLEKTLTTFRSIDETIELRVEKNFLGYKISIDE